MTTLVGRLLARTPWEANSRLAKMGEAGFDSLPDASYYTGRETMNPTQLGEMLVENGIKKYGRVLTTPTNMLASDTFERFCVGRKFTKDERKECEAAYKNRWRMLTE